MTVEQRVREFIVRLAPAGACDDCIADRLHLTVRQHANRKTVDLAKGPGFKRALGECVICKRIDKKVIRHA